MKKKTNVRLFKSFGCSIKRIYFALIKDERNEKKAENAQKSFFCYSHSNNKKKEKISFLLSTIERNKYNYQVFSFFYDNLLCM